MTWLLTQNKAHNIFHSILRSDKCRLALHYYILYYNKTNSNKPYIVIVVCSLVTPNQWKQLNLLFIQLQWLFESALWPSDGDCREVHLSVTVYATGASSFRLEKVEDIGDVFTISLYSKSLNIAINITTQDMERNEHTFPEAILKQRLTFSDLRSFRQCNWKRCTVAPFEGMPTQLIPQC